MMADNPQKDTLLDIKSRCHIVKEFIAFQKKRYFDSKILKMSAIAVNLSTFRANKTLHNDVPGEIKLADTELEIDFADSSIGIKYKAIISRQQDPDKKSLIVESSSVFLPKIVARFGSVEELNTFFHLLNSKMQDLYPPSVDDTGSGSD